MYLGWGSFSVWGHGSPWQIFFGEKTLWHFCQQRAKICKTNLNLPCDTWLFLLFVMIINPLWSTDVIAFSCAELIAFSHGSKNLMFNHCNQWPLHFFKNVIANFSKCDCHYNYYIFRRKEKNWRNMAEQTHDEILWAIIEELAELDSLMKEKEHLEERCCTEAEWV